MKRPSDDPLNDLDPDIAEVLMSRLDFREEPEDAGPDEPQDEETVVSVEWTPPAAPAAETEPSTARPVEDSPAADEPADGSTSDGAPAPTKVVRALTGNRTHQASRQEINKLAAEHGLNYAAAESVATGRMTLQSAVNLRRIRAAKARRDAALGGPRSSKKLIVLFAGLIAVFVWVLFIL